jgi:hypothetical protein
MGIESTGVSFPANLGKPNSDRAVRRVFAYGNPLPTHTPFPVYFGVLVWIGPWVRDPGLGSDFPLLR